MKPSGLMIAIGAKPKADASGKADAGDKEATAPESSASDKLFAEHAARAMAAAKSGDAKAFAKALKAAIHACSYDEE